MRDFPVFTTQNGVASIVLREVPYKGIAYITLQNTLNPKELLAECVDFCKVAGAEKVYATGHPILENYPIYTSVLKMQQSRENLPETDAALFPLTEKTLEQWHRLYNEKMENVPNASTMTREDANKLLACGAGYFVHRGQNLLGIGIAQGDKIEAVIAVQPGAGEDVLLALCGALFSEQVVLEVASTNKPALKLYDRLGFLKTGELSRWYDVRE